MEEFDPKTIDNPEHRGVVALLLRTTFTPSEIASKMHIRRQSLYEIAEKYLGANYLTTRRETLRTKTLATRIQNGLAAQESGGAEQPVEVIQGNIKVESDKLYGPVLQALKQLYFKGATPSRRSLEDIVGHGHCVRMQKIHHHIMQKGLHGTLEEPAPEELSTLSNPPACSLNEYVKSYALSHPGTPNNAESLQQYSASASIQVAQPPAIAAPAGNSPANTALKPQSQVLEIEINGIKVRWDTGNGDELPGCLLTLLTKLGVTVYA